MKNIVLTVLLTFLSFTAFSQIKYTEEKNPDLSKMLAKIHNDNGFGFKNYLIKTFIINTDLGYSKNEDPEGAIQNAYISVSFLGREITTKLYKVDTLINSEIISVVEAPDGFTITIAHGFGDDRTEESFTLVMPKK
ncbi:hypothetical protein [Flavobacterium sp.]|uniref:hypothetical protein n=1 Tax=Flavobacterium sp. TaxID=239 RepID=UPI00286B729C|nr:hypothetical protein [Flavobacterium sp.]